MKISFCVPAHNRAESVVTCVESLISQTMPADEYEIIVVDDGSTDGSADVVELLFAERGFGNGRVVRLPTNSGGASVPRNEAARLAVGDYLFFVDSDDYVTSDLAERVWACAQENDSDLIYVKHGQVGEGLVPAKGFAERGSRGRADIIGDKLLYATMVHKAFRRSEWVRLGMRFDPRIRVYEDMLVTVQFLFGTSVHSVLADKEYYFLVNREEVRLHDADQSLETTFELYAAVLDAILGSGLRERTYQLNSAATIINRIMRFGPASSHPYLGRTCPDSEVARWMGLWSGLLAHLPRAADRFVSARLRNQVRGLRLGRVGVVRRAVWIEDLRGRHRTLSRVLRRVYGVSVRVRTLQRGRL